MLDDAAAKIAEQSLYEERGDKQLAETFEPKVERLLTEADEGLDEAEQLPPEEEEEEEDQDQNLDDTGLEDEPEQGDDTDNTDNTDDTDDNLRRKKKQQGQNKKPQSTTSQPKPNKPVTANAPVGKPPVPAAGGGGGMAAKGFSQALLAVMKTPHFWIAVAIIVAIILIIMLIVWLAGGTHKAANETGGSVFVPMNYSDQKDRDLAAKVMLLRDSGKIVFSPDIAKDIEWDMTQTTPAIKLDKRVMITLKYLGDLWAERTNGVIQVGVAQSNGPDLTRRKAILKFAGLALNTGDAREEPLDAIAAYSTGQAIAIDTIGRISNELANACFDDHDQNRNNNAFVKVEWQEIASQEIIRPTYEQLQVDSKEVYTGFKVLQNLAIQAKKDPSLLPRYQAALTQDTWYTRVGDALDKMIASLDKMASLNGKGIDSRTKDYAGMATTALSGVRSGTRNNVLAWDETAVIQRLQDGLQYTFRMMQVANMVGWKKPNQCRLWKAYEARQHIRQTVLDIEKMPTASEWLEPGTNWNGDLMARQVIIYSPEDDLDNGWPEMDVFPRGADSVDEGGVGFDDTGKDGKSDEKDKQFMDLPVDGGVFSKASTIWVYKAQGAWENIQQYGGELALDVGVPGFAVLDQMHDKMSGTGTSVLSGERLKKVTYKNFVHIGF